MPTHQVAKCNLGEAICTEYNLLISYRSILAKHESFSPFKRQFSKQVIASLYRFLSDINKKEVLFLNDSPFFRS